jgi:hypothetical protein
MKNDVIFAEIGENGQANFDQEFEHLKKQNPEKFIGLNLGGNNFNQIDFSKFHITNLANPTNNSGGFSFNRCIFKNLKAEKKIINNIRFVDCIFLEGTELIFKDLQQNFPYPNAIHIDFSESNEENLNRKNQEIKLEISSDCNVLINLKKINLIDSLLSCLSTTIRSSRAKISNSTFEGLIILENSNIEFDKKIVAKEKTIKEKSYNEFILNENSSVILKKSKEKSFIKNFNLRNRAKALELSNCVIEKAKINGEITDKAIFNNVTFTNPPEIGDIKFKNCNVEFRDVKFKDTHSPQAIAGFRALNKACRDSNYHHGEIFFHGLTLEGIGRNLKYKSDFVEKIFSKAYKIFSNFGRSLNRPFHWLIILGFVVFVINWIGINKTNDLKLSQQLTINKFIIDNKQDLTNKDYFSDISSIIMKFYEEENQSNIINAKLVFRSAIGPLIIALPRDFIEDYEEKFFKEKINFTIYFLNIIHRFLSLGIWSIWLFMIRARFKL